MAGKRASRKSLPRCEMSSSAKGIWALSISASIIRATTSRGASSPSGWYPLAKGFLSLGSSKMAPSPLRASVRRKRRSPGMNRVVGWNCMNSILAILAPARMAMASPSPRQPEGLDVCSHRSPQPPVASTVARAATRSKPPSNELPPEEGVGLRTKAPPHRSLPGWPSRTRSMARLPGRSSMFGCAASASTIFSMIALPVSSRQWMMRGRLCEASRQRLSSPLAPRSNGTACAPASRPPGSKKRSTTAGPSATSLATAAESHSPAPARCTSADSRASSVGSSRAL
mmetsp:Transcript_51654/g.117629  ORF Transcript_51654/g.117629 Transcript_51654/m.117629 type:complete len:285 (-) Transcript_51654:526-1380(-)